MTLPLGFVRIRNLPRHKGTKGDDQFSPSEVTPLLASYDSGLCRGAGDGSDS